MSMLFAYMAGGEGDWELEVLKCFVRGDQNFFGVCGGCQVQYPSFREKKNNRPPAINK